MKQLLGVTRYVVLIGVVGSLIASATLFVSTLVNVAKNGAELAGSLADPSGLKRLAIAGILVADYFPLTAGIFATPTRCPQLTPKIAQSKS